MKRRLLGAAVWVVVGAVFASQLYLFALRSGWRMPLWDAVMWEFPRWVLWAIFTPVVYWILKLFPLEKERRIKRILQHAVASILVSLTHLISFVLLFHFTRLGTGSDGRIIDTLKSAFPLDFHVGIVVYWLILLLRHLRDSERKLSQLQAELARAQLQALKMQLHPHFLFNTLNSISALLHKDVETADEMIGELGEFLRLTLKSPDATEVVLRKEIDFLKCYLGIEQLRFKDRLETQFEISPETLEALVPNLILQPIVENAIHHGVSMRTGSGQIRVVAQREKERLHISIQDDGPGVADEIREGIGLANTRERLERIYGGDYHLELTNLSGDGFKVRIEIPFRIAVEAM